LCWPPPQLPATALPARLYSSYPPEGTDHAHARDAATPATAPVRGRHRPASAPRRAVARAGGEIEGAGDAQPGARLHPDLLLRRAVAPRHVRHEARRARGGPRRVQADPHLGAGCPRVRAFAEVGPADAQGRPGAVDDAHGPTARLGVDPRADGPAARRTRPRAVRAAAAVLPLLRQRGGGAPARQARRGAVRVVAVRLPQRP